MEMPNADQVNKFHDLMRKCREKPVDELLQNPTSWGEIDFKEIQSYIEILFKVMIQLDGLPLNAIPFNIFNSLYTQLQTLHADIKEIQDFSIKKSPASPNLLPENRRDQLCAHVKSRAGKFYEDAFPLLPSLAFQQAEDFQKKTVELERGIREKSEKLDTFEKEFQEKGTKLDNIIAEARKTAGKAGVDIFHEDFSNEAKANQKSAWGWLVVSFLFTVLTLYTSLYFPTHLFISDQSAEFQITQYVTTKVVILGLLFTVTIWCGRMYKASKHLSTVNRHRANALRTFQAFTSAAKDDAAKDAVLMETTKSIFTHTPSGYLDCSETSSDSGLKIVEMIKNARGAN